MLLKRHILFLACTVFSFCACKKENTNFPIKGRVTDATTQIGMSGAVVSLQTFDPSCRNNCSGSTVQTAVADANGNYEFTSFQPEHGKAYRLVCYVNNYFDNYANVITFDPEDHADEMNFALHPEAWLKFHVKNVNPFDSNDHFRFNQYDFYGTQVDTTFLVGTMLGNSDWLFGWYVTKNNVFTSHDSLIYCPAFDTTVCNINY